MPFVCMQTLDGSRPWKPIDPFVMGRGRASLVAAADSPTVTLTCMSVDCVPVWICLIGCYFRSCLAEFVIGFYWCWKMYLQGPTYKPEDLLHMPWNWNCPRITPPHPINLMPFTCLIASSPSWSIKACFPLPVCARSSSPHLPLVGCQWNNY